MWQTLKTLLGCLMIVSRVSNYDISVRTQGEIFMRNEIKNDNDWRLFREQDKYLLGVTLIKQSYKSNNPNNDHDHCEFCMAKFGSGNDELKQGYSTEDSSIWICSQCYEDFKIQFEWNVKYE